MLWNFKFQFNWKIYTSMTDKNVDNNVIFVLVIIIDY